NRRAASPATSPARLPADAAPPLPQGRGSTPRDAVSTHPIRPLPVTPERRRGPSPEGGSASNRRRPPPPPATGPAGPPRVRGHPAPRTPPPRLRDPTGRGRQTGAQRTAGAEVPATERSTRSWRAATGAAAARLCAG